MCTHLEYLIAHFCARLLRGMRLALPFKLFASISLTNLGFELWSTRVVVF